MTTPDSYEPVRKKITYPKALYEELAYRATATVAALDKSCGNGVSSINLSGYFDRVDACDQSATLIGKARKSNPNINFYVSNAEKFNAAGDYDLITSVTSFYWMDRAKILGYVSMWLKPGGVFCAY